jgi:hypothetical protein
MLGRMPRFLPTLALLALTGTALAQAPGLPLPVKEVETSVTADFDGDRLADYAMLVRAKDKENGEKTSRFQIYLRLHNPNQARFRRIIDAEVGFGDKLHASLRLNPRGSIILRTSYQASGAGDRETWTRVLTMQVRNGEALVIGYAYSSGDRITGKVESSCDINLLTGSGITDGKPVRVEVKPIPARLILNDDGNSPKVPGCEE